ncbi:hypothetical protein IMZ48_01205 [Candidatus Bathyarchaeota archaeon]|nr:hypothetical protein [Candidatus Bathyarchaeota archaeon]
MRFWLPSALALLGLGLLPAVGAQGSSSAMDALPDCAVCDIPDCAAWNIHADGRS